MKLRKSYLVSNWKNATFNESPRFCHRGGDLIDHILQSIHDTLEREDKALEFFEPSDHRSFPGATRSLRCCQRDGFRHVLFTDVALTRKGDGFVLQFATGVRSALSYARIGIHGFIYLNLFCWTMFGILSYVDIERIWEAKYRNIYLPGQLMGTAEAVAVSDDGNLIKLDSQESRLNMLQRDPLLLLSVIGPWTAAVAGLVGIVNWLIPRRVMNGLCRLLGTETPVELERAAQSHRNYICARVLMCLSEAPFQIHSSEMCEL